MTARWCLLAVVLSALLSEQCHMYARSATAGGSDAAAAAALGHLERVRAARRELAVALSLHAATVSGSIQAEALTEAMVHVRKCLAMDTQDYQLQFYAAVNVDRLLRDHSSAGMQGVSRDELRTYCTMARTSLNGDNEQLSREQPLANLRYIYTICCESLRPVGGDGHWSQTRQLRDACWSEAVARGAWPTTHQRPMELNTSLTSRPVWSLGQLHAANEGGAVMVRLLRAVGARWRTVRTEALEALRQSGTVAVREHEGLHERGQWDELPFVVHGVRNVTSCRLCPVTCALLAPLERLGANDGGPRYVGQMKLSLLAPGDTYIKPHVGPNNRRLRAHLPLAGLNGASLTVAGTELRWSTIAPGDWLLFDDSYEHEVLHTGEAARLVLIVDLPHPQLAVWDTDAELFPQMQGTEASQIVDGDSGSCASSPERQGTTFAALVWPITPSEFFSRLWQRRGAVLRSTAVDATPSPPGVFALDDTVMRSNSSSAKKPFLLGFEDVWTLLENPVLVDRNTMDRYGGFVKVINGTMRKWQLRGGHENQQGHTDNRMMSLADQARQQHRLGNSA